MITTGLRHAVSRTALALLIIAFAPVIASAETITFRNDTPATIVVQVTSVVRGTVMRERPATLSPNDVSRTDLPGNKIITISDARKPTNVLYQGAISSSNEDLYLLIKVDPLLPNRLKLEKTRGPTKP
jgi:hypothetical protein